MQLCRIQRELAQPTQQQEARPEECQEDRYIQEIKQQLEKRIEFYWTRGQVCVGSREREGGEGREGGEEGCKLQECKNIEFYWITRTVCEFEE